MATDPELFRPVNTEAYWKQRVQDHQADLRRMMWDGSNQQWTEMERQHRTKLIEVVKPTWTVLDAGCGYGRLLSLMPPEWIGNYVGVDVSPELIAMAQERHPARYFRCSSLLDLPASWTKSLHKFDVAVCCMLKHMVVTHVGQGEWLKIEAALLRVASRLLILEPRGFEL